MAFLGLKTPHETARLLSGLEVPGKKESVAHFHVTMIFFGSGLDIDRLAEIVRVTFGVTEKTKPFTARTSQITSFPGGEDGKPIICRVESDALHELRDRIKEAYEAEGVEFNTKHPEFKPHMTLAYDDSGDEFEERRIPTVEWGAHELVLWGGDKGDEKLIVSFPFALDDPAKVEKTAAGRVVQRYLGDNQ